MFYWIAIGYWHLPTTNYEFCCIVQLSCRKECQCFVSSSLFPLCSTCLSIPEKPSTVGLWLPRDLAGSVAQGSWSLAIQLNTPHVNTRATCPYMCRLSDELQDIAKSARDLEGFQFLWLVCDLFMRAALIDEVKNLLDLSMKVWQQHWHF